MAGAKVGDRVVMLSTSDRHAPAVRSKVAGTVSSLTSAGAYVVWDTSPLKSINGKGQRIAIGPYQPDRLEVIP